MKKVRNKKTGLVHTVPDGHWSLKHEDYEEVKEEAKKKAAK